jgi:hypothetical protein
MQGFAGRQYLKAIVPPPPRAKILVVPRVTEIDSNSTVTDLATTN